jgi:hypothetical protein
MYCTTTTFIFFLKITTEQTIGREMNNLSSNLRKVNPTIPDEAMSMISKLEKELQKLKEQFGIK